MSNRVFCVSCIGLAEARGVKVLAGVGHGKVLLWEYLGERWGGAAAATAYRGPIKTALEAEYPGCRSYTLLEDNDPSGFRSWAGRCAKEEVKIKVFEIPKRSPVLNVCDYYLWSAVNKRMREQERTFPKTKRETRQAFLRRLRRTAMSIPVGEVTAAVGDMQRRCSRLQAAKGGHIEEGGRSAQP